MDNLVGVFTGIKDFSAKLDDDFTDRLSNRYTVVILLACAALVGMHQYVGTPINCWIPPHFTGSHTRYAHSYCWVKNTYYLPFESKIPRRGEHDAGTVIPYYQWIPFILISQAILFYFPSVVWHGLNQKGGVDADSLLSAAQTFNRTDKVESKKDTLIMIIMTMERFLGIRGRTNVHKTKHGMLYKMKHALNKCCCNVFGHRFGAYLSCLYLFTKLLYILNVIGQLFMLNKILSTNFNIFGAEILYWMITSDHDRWHSLPQVTFPRVTMCDFRIRRLGNIHRYSMQCALPINLYNEKIYAFLWFWMVLVAFCTVYSFVVWLLRLLYFNDGLHFIQLYIETDRTSPKLSEKEKEALKGSVELPEHPEGRLKVRMEELEEFVYDYLVRDGVFLLRLIEHNTNSITTAEIVIELYHFWATEKAKNLLAAVPTAPLAVEDDNDNDVKLPLGSLDDVDEGKGKRD